MVDEDATLRHGNSSVTLDELTLPPMERAQRVSNRYPVTYKHSVHLERRGFRVPFDYHLSAIYRCSGRLDEGAFRTALLCVISRHEALFAVYGKDGSSFFLDVPEVAPTSFSYVRVAASSEPHARVILNERHREPFDLKVGPFLRGTIVDLPTGEWLLQITVDHFVCDGASYSVVLDEFSLIYNAVVSDGTHDLDPHPYQLSDYAVWQRSILNGPLLESMLDRWQQLLKRSETERDVGSAPLHAAASYSRFVQHALPSGFGSQLKDAARRHRVTPFALAAGAFASVLAEDTSGATPIFNSPLSGRPLADQHKVVGDLVNVLPIALMPDDINGVTPTAVMKGLGEIMTLQATPFHIINEMVSREPDRYTSLKDRLFFAFSEEVDLRLAGIDCAVVPATPGDAITKGSFWIDAQGDGYNLSALYDQDRFSDDELDSFMSRYVSRLIGLITNEGVVGV